MSAKAVGWALEQPLEPLPKIILVTLADCLNIETLKCIPSQEFLASRAMCSERTVSTHLKVLEEGGYLQRVKRNHPVTGYRLSDGYILALPESSSGRPTGSATSRQPEAAASGQEPERNQNSLLPSVGGVAEQVRDVFEHWRTTVPGRSNCTLTDPRRAKITTRLKRFDVATLKKAIDQAARDPFLNGANEREKSYTDFVTIFRTDDKVEDLLADADKPHIPRAAGNGRRMGMEDVHAAFENLDRQKGDVVEGTAEEL